MSEFVVWRGLPIQGLTWGGLSPSYVVPAGTSNLNPTVRRSWLVVDLRKLKGFMCNWVGNLLDLYRLSS